MSNEASNTASLRLTPFQKEGTNVTQSHTIDSIIEAAALGYQVEKAPLFIVEKIAVGNEGDTVEQVAALPSGFITRRTDTKTEFGLCTAAYQVVQNLDAMRVVEPLLDQGLISPISAGSFRHGADAWFQFRITDSALNGASDTFARLDLDPLGVVSTNHDARRRVALGPCTTRIVCQNTLAMATKQAIDAYGGVAHRSGAEKALVEVAMRAFDRLIKVNVEAAKEYDILANTVLTAAEFRHLVLDEVAPIPKVAEAVFTRTLTPREEGNVARAFARRDLVTRLWTEGRGHTGDNSAWEAFNGVAEAIDHHPVEFRSHADGKSRAFAIFAGSLGEKKDAVRRNLLAFAKGVR